MSHVFVIDIDGTIIGDILYEVCEWEIIMKCDPRKIKFFKQRLIAHLRAGLLRPYLADFVTTLKKQNEANEFFVYTASDDKWAQFLIPCIESACNVKFKRPIFSRKHCIVSTMSVKKCLANISTQVFQRLKPMGIYKNKTQLHNQMILIDNNYVLIDQETKKGIICPTYDHKIVYDVLRNLDEYILHERIGDIIGILQKYSLIPQISEKDVLSSYQILAMYYKNYSNKLSQYSSLLEKGIKRDKYWLNLANLFVALNKKGVSTDKMIKYINTKTS